MERAERILSMAVAGEGGRLAAPAERPERRADRGQHRALCARVKHCPSGPRSSTRQQCGRLTDARDDRCADDGWRLSRLEPEGIWPPALGSSTEALKRRPQAGSISVGPVRLAPHRSPIEKSASQPFTRCNVAPRISRSYCTLIKWFAAKTILACKAHRTSTSRS